VRAVARGSRQGRDHSSSFRLGARNPSRPGLGNRRQLGHLRSQTGRIALQDEQTDLVEHLVDDLRGARDPLRAQDLLGGRGLRALAAKVSELSAVRGGWLVGS